MLFFKIIQDFAIFVFKCIKEAPQGGGGGSVLP